MKPLLQFLKDTELPPIDSTVGLAKVHYETAYDEARGPRLRRGPSIFDDFPWPEQKEEAPPPLPCAVFTRTQVLLHNLKVAGYDLSQVAANDNGRLSAALEVVLCRKRGLEDPEQVAAAIGISVDAVVTAINDLHLAAKAG